MLIFRRWRLLVNRRVLVASIGAGAVAMTWLRWSGQTRWLVDTPYLTNPWNWAWYPLQMIGAFGFIIPAAAAIGATVGLVAGRWRREVAASGSWILIYYSFFSYLYGKDIRYWVPLAAPLISMTAVAVWATSEGIGGRLGPGFTRASRVAATAVITAAQVGIALSVAFPNVCGFGAIVDAIQDDQVLGGGSILDGLGGPDSATFTCAVMLDDPDFRLRVLPFEWLLDYAGVGRPSNTEVPGPSETEEIEALLAHSGCRWVVVRVGEEPTQAPSARRLREALRGPRYKLVRIFAVEGERPAAIGLYRRNGPIGELSDLERRLGSRGRWLLRDPVSR